MRSSPRNQAAHIQAELQTFCYSESFDGTSLMRSLHGDLLSNSDRNPRRVEKTHQEISAVKHEERESSNKNDKRLTVTC